MIGFSMNNDSVIFLRDRFAAVPDFFYKRAGSIIFFCLNADVIQSLFNGERGPKCGDQYNVIGREFFERNKLLPISVLEKALRRATGDQHSPAGYGSFHLAGKSVYRDFLRWFERRSRLHFPHHSKNQNDARGRSEGAKIQQGRAEIFFHPVHFLPLFFDRGDQADSVNDRNFETFHHTKFRAISG